MINEELDSRIKGLPHSDRDLPLSEISTKRWNVLAEDLPLPVAILRGSTLRNNREWMREFLAQTGAKVAPHGKTYMSPEIFHMHLADGAWAITLATIQQVRVARSAGVNRILLANEMIGGRDIAYILDELNNHPSFEFYCLVDSLAGVHRLSQAIKARLLDRPLQLLIEIGYTGGRTGCRDLESTLNVARAIKAAKPQLALCGVEGFEGLHQYLPCSEAVPRVRNFLSEMVKAARQLELEHLFDTEEIILSAGGSAYYDLVVESLRDAQLHRRTSIVLRSGCYLIQDVGRYERLFQDVVERSTPARDIRYGLQNVLEVWCYVISVPERDRAILGAGRRDFGEDAGLPIPLKKYRPVQNGKPEALVSDYRIVTVNDQHAHMKVPAGADVRVGDMIALGVSHPCTTFDKWQIMYVVNDDYTVESAIRTYF